MASVSTTATAQIDPEQSVTPRAQLRVLTCGSVDDGKSTLIGRLLADTNSVPEDALADAVGRDGQVDYANLVDGLLAEREQGITIDVAYRYFSSARRSFIVADTPGHEQYTRNMATGASNSEAAIILCDATQGVLPQTRRHMCICYYFGVRHIILAVNKMDLVNNDQSVFDALVADFDAFAKQLGSCHVTALPVSALTGANVATRAAELAWFHGPTLLDALETMEPVQDRPESGLRFPVQLAVRPGSGFRGYAGQVVSGRVSVGEDVTVMPSGERTRISRIVTLDGDQGEALVGDAVTLVLEDERDVSRGDMIVAAKDRPDQSDQIQADLLWMDRKPLLPGRSYLLRTPTQSVGATVTLLKDQLNVETLDRLAASQLACNEIGRVNISCDAPLVFDPFESVPATGTFVLVDMTSNQTVGAGIIRFGLRRAENIHWQKLELTKSVRAGLKNQRPCCLWFTGLSGSGKSTVASLLEQRLAGDGRHTYILDGDNVRHGLNRDLGFTDADRVENIRRVAEVSKLFVDAGLIVLVSFISPFRSERDMARAMFDGDEFLEVFVDTPIEVCEARDPKGLYAKARAGKIKNFTGIDSAYEPPLSPEIKLDTVRLEADELVESLILKLQAHDVLSDE